MITARQAAQQRVDRAQADVLAVKRKLVDNQKLLLRAQGEVAQRKNVDQTLRDNLGLAEALLAEARTARDECRAATVVEDIPAPVLKTLQDAAIASLR